MPLDTIGPVSDGDGEAVLSVADGDALVVTPGETSAEILADASASGVASPLQPTARPPKSAIVAAVRRSFTRVLREGDIRSAFIGFSVNAYLHTVPSTGNIPAAFSSVATTLFYDIFPAGLPLPRSHNGLFERHVVNPFFKTILRSTVTNNHDSLAIMICLKVINKCFHTA